MVRQRSRTLGTASLSANHSNSKARFPKARIRAKLSKTDIGLTRPYWLLSFYYKERSWMWPTCNTPNNSIVLRTIMRPLTRSPPFERWFDVLRSPQISDAPDRAAQLSRYRHARAQPGILRIWSTPRRPACSAKRYARNRAYGLPPPVP